MKSFFLFGFLVFFLSTTEIFHVTSSKASVNEEEFDLSSPEITIDYLDPFYKQKRIRLELYECYKNKKIIKNNKDGSKYNQLKWASYGGPILLKKNTESNVTLLGDYFKFTKDDVSIQIDMLVNQHRSFLLEKIQQEHNIPNLKHDQIENLIPKSLQCRTQFWDKSNSQKVELVGRANFLESFPLRVEFMIEQGTRERESLENRIKEDQARKNQDEDSFAIRFDCELVLDDEDFSSRIDEEPENFLKIDSNELNLKYGLLEQLFGKSSSVLVMHEQLVQFTNQIYRKLNIFDEFGLNEDEFADIFLEDLVKQTANGVRKFVDIKELKELSEFEFEDGKIEVTKRLNLHLVKRSK
jgi:hypothetical protein